MRGIRAAMQGLPYGLMMPYAWRPGGHGGPARAATEGLPYIVLINPPSSILYVRYPCRSTN